MPELYVVLWNDAHGSSGMVSDHEIEHKPYVFTTAGMLVRSDTIGVSMAHDRGEDGQWRDVTFIPRLMVIDEWSQGPIRKPRKRNPKPEVTLPQV